MAKPGKKKKTAKKHLVEGLVSIYATFNNTIVTIANRQGNTVSWASAGNVGFKGSRKNTPFAAQVAAEKAGRAAQEMGLEAVDVKVKGPGSGRDSAVRGLNNLGIRVMSITDITPIAHNGCRPAKKRRS